MNEENIFIGYLLKYLITKKRKNPRQSEDLNK